jgi:hypothetical protein
MSDTSEMGDYLQIGGIPTLVGSNYRGFLIGTFGKVLKKGKVVLYDAVLANYLYFHEYRKRKPRISPVICGATTFIE